MLSKYNVFKNRCSVSVNELKKVIPTVKLHCWVQDHLHCFYRPLGGRRSQADNPGFRTGLLNPQPKIVRNKPEVHLSKYMHALIQNDIKRGKVTLIHWAVHMSYTNHSILLDSSKCVVIDNCDMKKKKNKLLS